MCRGGSIYTGEVKRGVPVNPTAFWGLRYRLGYSAYPPGAPLEGTRYSSKRLVRQFSLLRRGHWGRNRKRKQMAKE